MTHRYSLGQDVTITAPCPGCGGDATWHGHRDQQTGTRWRHIDCPTCSPKEVSA